MSAEETMALYIRQYVEPKTIEIKLDKNRVNYVAILFGSFNPPHTGHLDLLTHTVQNCGDDLNISCALMAPRPPSFFKSKYVWELSPLILPDELRARLCYTDERLPKWAGVMHESPDDYSYYYFGSSILKSIQERASQLEMRLQFLSIHSTERDMALSWRYLEPDQSISMILVNTHGRQGGDVFNSWQLESENWQRLPQSGPVVQLYQTLLRYRMDGRAGLGYVRVIYSSSPHVSDISSTIIRSLASDHDEDIIAHHEGMNVVLSWELLRTEETWKAWHAESRKSQIGLQQRRSDKL